MLRETWSTFERFRKIVLCALAAMLLLFGVLQTASAFRRGVVFGDGLLTVTQTGETTVYTGKSYGEPVTVTVRPVSDTLTEITFVIGGVIHDVCTLETGLPPFTTEKGEEITDTLRAEKNGALLFDGGYAQRQDYGRYHRDGSWDAPISVSTGTGGTYWENHPITLGNINYFARGPEQVCRGDWGMYVVLVLLTLLLAADVAHPLFLFRLEHHLDVKDPEPSDFYLATQRIGWVIFPVLLLFGYIWALRQLP